MFAELSVVEFCIIGMLLQLCCETDSRDKYVAHDFFLAI
jgi:hypothetical protein